MTEVQDNPYVDDTETYARPRRWVMEVRHSLSEPYVSQMDVPADLLERFQDRVAQHNATAGYRKYRIVSR